jgi:hypothetical protein
VTDDTLLRSSAARLKAVLEPLHAMIYFAPEPEERYVAAGLRPGRMGYFASRSAAFGAVGPGVVAATFYNFNPALVAKHIPRAWTLATPEAVLQARNEGADAALTRLLGDAIASPELIEAAELARQATTVLFPDGRALYAAHADLPWPESPQLVLFHAITLLREWRGDAHVAALVGHQLNGLDALITHTATGLGFNEPTAKLTRGWSDEQWDAAVSRLQEHGILDGAGGLTEAGVRQRESVEEMTDRTSLAPLLALGDEGTARLIELGRGLSRIAVANGAIPSSVAAPRR